MIYQLSINLSCFYPYIQTLFMKKYNLFIFCLLPILAFSQAKIKPTDANEVKETSFNKVVNGMGFREIGPAVTSGRIIDIAVNPNNKFQWYIAAACGGIWKTDNAGTSFTPIFDTQASFSIGCIKIDSKNEHTIWVGTGENNNQRSVAYGDGVYKSEDDGKTWKNMGLKNSEHIGMISIDPNNSNIVYVAAYGPLWSAGGERGIYKTTDGGATWNRILFVSENTGFNEVHIDPNNANILYATAHQRRRHEWTYISGGPESGLYKSTDFGATWAKIENGFPKGDVGRIGLAVSPVNSDYVYAIVEEQGVFLSTNRGTSWEKRSDHSTAGNYYMEIFADPLNVNKIYSMNNWAVYSQDGGKTFTGMGEKNKHVDNHALWIDKDDTKHKLMGCDGGLYETWDDCKTWDYKSNLPLTQFYRVTVDNALPFYNIYGGTQDNNTLGGPSRTKSANGIHNYDWFVTVGGDGFKTVVDPKDPNIVYSQWQYGGLVRFNKLTGEALDIKPQEKVGESAYRYNWDAPLHLSYHNNTTLYFAAQKIFKSTDKGNTWQVISPDLSSGIDRNKLPVMGKVWSIDGVAKNQSTSIYGNISAFAESPKNANVLYAGTDDGLIHITNDGGASWTKISNFGAVPNQVFVQNIVASKHDENTVYAIFNNHRNGDFKPYILKSINKGKTWVNIKSNLPERGSAQCLAEDHVQKDLLFVGTEFGLFTSFNAGKNWVKMAGGLPTIMVKEIAIQERENDLVLATFGRGFWVLDNYTALQQYSALQSDIDTKNAAIFPIKDAVIFIPSTPLGHKGKSFQGESFYTANNPPIGASIQYFIKNDYKTIKEIRKGREEKQTNDYYPSIDSIRLENKDQEPFVLALIYDENKNLIRTLKQPAKSGFYTLIWDGRLAATSPVTFYTPNPDNPYEGEDRGPMAVPGKYSIELMLNYQNKLESLATSTFTIKPLTNNNWLANNNFNKDIAEFRRVVLGVNSYCTEAKNKINYIKALNVVKNENIKSKLFQIEELLNKINLQMNGDGSIASREFETLPGIVGSIEGIVGNLWATTELSTTTYKEKLEEVKNKFKVTYTDAEMLQTLLVQLEKDLEILQLPYTPGRFPIWKR